eukprot:Skav235502  [mRNA]  locus=scaffold625:50873:56431:+ [translate_table: standard]
MSEILLSQCRPLALIDRYEIFTDGSFRRSDDENAPTAAWAFTVFAHGTDQDGLSACEWKGYFAGEVIHHSTSEHDTKGIGVVDLSSYEAERSALWWAAAYLLQLPDSYPACLKFDSTSAGFSAAGRVAGKEDDGDVGIGATLRGIHQYLEQFRSITYQHVKGHTGQAGNELADAIADACCSGQIPDTTPDLDLAVLTRSAKDFMQWAFADAFQPDRPQLGDQAIWFQGFQPANQLPFSWRPGEVCRPSPASLVDVDLNFVSYNVMTMRRYGSVSLMKQSLSDHQVHVAGFQETRDQRSCVWPGNPFMRFCSAATSQGEGGLQLWISTAKPFATCQGRPLFFSKKHFTVAVATPRLLIVHAHVSGILFSFLVGHAPHSGDDRAEAWWATLQQHMRAIPEHSQKILMIDANSRMAGFNDEFCGPDGPDHRESHQDASDAFHQTLVENQMFLPSTLSRYHSGSHTTWSIGDREGGRLDYVAIPTSWKRGSHASQVAEDIRSGVSNHDHKAVFLRCHIALEGSVDRFHRRMPLDRHAMTTESGVETCRAIFQEMPRLPSSTDPTIHCHVVEQYLQQALETHFKLNRRAKKKHFLTDATYSAALKHTSIMMCFQAWANISGLSTTAPRCTPEEFAGTLANIDQGIARLSQMRSSTLQALQTSLKADRHKHVQEVCAQIAQAPFAEIWDRLKPLLPKHRRGLHSVEHLPGLKNDCGIMATTPQEVARIFQQHFSNAEGGSQHHPDEIVSIFLKEQQSLYAEIMEGHFTPSLSHVPTLQALESKFRKVRLRKACGPDGLPGELFRAAPTEAASAYHSLVTKVCVFGADPLQWRGGIVKAIYKRGASELPSSWRNILLSSIPGKAAHSLIRDALNQCYQQAAHPGQFGGRSGSSIHVPTMGVRSFQRWCKCQNRSYALIFVDGVEAFYRLVRELCYQFHDEGAFLDALERSSVSPRLRQIIFDQAQKASALTQSHATDHLTFVTRALHRVTWFLCEQESQHVALTTRGSRPGDPIADVLFNLVMGQAMHHIDDRLRDHGLMENFPLHHDQPLPSSCRNFASATFSGQAWVDDLIYMTSCDDPARLLSQVSQIVSIVQQELASMGIELNLQQGKSEAILHLAGPGSRQLRRELHVENGSMIRFQDVEGSIQTIHAGHKYKYLGSILSIQGNCLGDIKHRAGQTFAALKLVRRPVFKNAAAPPRVRQMVLHSIILSKMMATSGSWIFDTKQAEQCFQKTIMRIYRYVFVLRPDWDKSKHYSHDEIIRGLGVLTPTELLHVHRLRGLISAVIAGTPHIWALLHADQRWLQHVQEALDWVHCQTSMSVTGEEPHGTLQDFIRLVEDFPHRARGLLRRSQAAALNMRLRENNTCRWHHKFSQQLLELGYVEPAAPIVIEDHDDDQEGFLCPQCGKFFPSLRQTAVHMHRAHSIYADHFLWAKRTSCLCCMQEFHTRKRLAAHFQHGGRQCLQRLKLRYPDPNEIMDDVLVPNMDHVPFVPVSGPAETWCASLVDEQRGWAKKKRQPRPKPAAVPPHSPVCHLSRPEFPAILPEDVVWIPQHIRVPVQFVLHLFSGRRRHEDLQHHVELVARDLPFQVFVLSLDVAIDDRLGDLSSDEAYDFWTDKAKRGFILSFMAGPPCETFTRSRFRAGGPPPLRSRMYRWGLPGLLGNLHRQVESGSFLWRFTTAMIASQMSSGKGGIFEHPAPYEIDHGSCRGGIHTWAFPEMLALMKWPSIVLHHVEQGKFGQICRKPTSFLVLNHHKAASIFQEWQLPRHLWRLNAIAMGWNQANRCFATAPLKEYPGRLNAALARVLLSGLDTHPKSCEVDWDGELFGQFARETSHLCQVLDGCDRTNMSMRPDWHRS